VNFGLHMAHDGELRSRETNFLQGLSSAWWIGDSNAPRFSQNEFDVASEDQTKQLSLLHVSHSINWCTNKWVSLIS
jgi:hypothetical protein